jgi:hypothetical protein
MSFNCTVTKMFQIKSSMTSLGREKEREYKSQRDSGRAAEVRCLKLVNDFVELVDSAWLTDKASLLDVSYKVDLVVETDGNAIGIQIKTSDAGKAKHDANAEYHSGPYDYPDCVVGGKHRRGYEILIDLCNYLGLGAKERYVHALKYANYYKGSIQPKLAIKRWGDLVTLGLAIEIGQQELRFIGDPPPVPPKLAIEED